MRRFVRPSIKTTLVRAAVFGCLACSGGEIAAQTVELSLDQARVAARQAALSGQFELAQDFALALTDADPDDRTALIVLAAVQPQLGRPSDGRRAGARAYRLAQTDGEQYEAARLTALAAANEDRYTLSQIWLRRAAANAPDERAYNQTRADYRGIRRLNPMSVTLGFSISPSSNVNGGSETEYNIIDGLPFVGILSGSAQALSGLAATADFRLGYAVTNGANHRTTLQARAYARTVWLSQEARDIAPATRNSEFGSQVLEIGLSHRHRIGDASLSAEAAFGANWFGGDFTADYLRGGLSYATPLNARTRLTVAGEVQRNNLQGNFPRSNLRSKLTSGLSFITDGGNIVSGQLSYETQDSNNLNERYESLTMQASYSWADPVGPVHLSVSAGASFSEYPDYSIIFPVPGGRQDTRIFGNLQAVVQGVEYAGFVPVLTLGVQDTQSNVSRFERNEYSLGIGVRSSF